LGVSGGARPAFGPGLEGQGAQKSSKRASRSRTPLLRRHKLRVPESLDSLQGPCPDKSRTTAGHPAPPGLHQGQGLV
jgi:hypothetical protein